jgi:hypothetical protein
MARMTKEEYLDLKLAHLRGVLLNLDYQSFEWQAVMCMTGGATTVGPAPAVPRAHGKVVNIGAWQRRAPRRKGA